MDTLCLYAAHGIVVIFLIVLSKCMNEHVVIIGGGFAGLQFVKSMKNFQGTITLIDRQNHHQFQPLFYQVASARLEPASISFPFRKIFQHHSNLGFRLADVISVDAVAKQVHTSQGDIAYDKLVIATGCDTNFFNNASLQKYAMPMKTTQESIAIRNNILLTFEEYLSAEEQQKESLLNIVIVGGGPTGVELSGAFAEMRNDVLPNDYPHVDFSKMRIILVEGSANTLNAMRVSSREASARYLKELGVELIMQSFVVAYDGETLELNTGVKIKSRNVIWSAGVKGNIIPGLDAAGMERNRYLVDRFNQLVSIDSVYAIGDISLMRTPKYPDGHPQVANVAINQARNLAHNLLRSSKGKSLREYEYFDKGSMATIGKNRAVVDLPFLHLQGRFAWYIWMFLHLMLILSVRNKLIIFMNWAWSYFNHDSSLRLILSTRKRHNL